MGHARKRPVAARRGTTRRRLRAIVILLLRRLDRNPPQWLRNLTPVASSVALHTLALLVLGLFVLSGHQHRPHAMLESTFEPGQLRDDLMTADPSDHAGDPFTLLESDEPPSLTLDPTRANPAVSNTPELPANAKYGPQLQLTSTRPALSPTGLGPATRLGDPIAWTTPFSGRRADVRASIVQREGGTVRSEQAVERGLDWIARHQRADGGWSLDVSGECGKPACPPVPAMKSDMAAGGLAILPLLGAGHSHTEKGRFQNTLKRGLDWMIAHQQNDGSLIDQALSESGNSAFYTHAIATTALCEAYGISRDKRLHDPAQRAVDYIVATQSAENGGWRYFPGQAGDTSVTGWQMLALRSAQMAGLQVPKGTIQRVAAYLDLAAGDPKSTTYAYQPGRSSTPSMTAVALLIRQYLGWPRNHFAISNGSRIVAMNLTLNKERNIYYWYYATPFLHNVRGPQWVKWNNWLRENLIATQMKGNGCDAGSWHPEYPTPDRWGRRAGRLFQTSLSVLTLEVYYRYLPLYQSQQGDEDRNPTPKGAALGLGPSRAGATKSEAK